MGQRSDANRAVEEFYDLLAGEYDLMTGYAQRSAAERPIFERIIQQFAIKSAVDAGCGTGFHSVLLAQLGVQITAADVASEMLQRTAAHAREAGVDVEIVRSDFEHLAEHVPNPVDAVFCLGNSLVHLLESEGLRNGIDNFFRLLKGGGTLVVQILNYDRILAERSRVQGIKEIGRKTYVRFYDFVGDLLIFNVLTIERSAGGLEHHLSSVSLRPIKMNDLRILLDRAGFVDVEGFGALSLEPFKASSSKDIVIVARTPQV